MKVKENITHGLCLKHPCKDYEKKKSLTLIVMPQNDIQQTWSCALKVADQYLSLNCFEHFSFQSSVSKQILMTSDMHVIVTKSYQDVHITTVPWFTAVLPTLNKELT